MSIPSPGKTLLKQFLQPRRLSQNALARAIGVPPRRINEIILGKRGISADTALRLGHYFGNGAEYWMQLQMAADLSLARICIGDGLSRIESTLPPTKPRLKAAGTTTSPAEPNTHKRHSRPGAGRRIMR